MPAASSRPLVSISGNIQQVAFLTSDKQAGPFKLEIDWIKAYNLHFAS